MVAASPTFGSITPHRPTARVVAEPLGQPNTDNLPPGALQELQAAREEAELTLEQLHLVQEELEVYFLKAEELSDTLSSRDQQISDLQQQLEAARQASAEQASTQALEQQHASAMAHLQSQHTAELSKIQKQHKQEITALNKALADQQRELKAIQPQLEQANQSQREAEARAEETQKLLSTAQKMLEGQANYLQDLSRKEEEAELAIERERLFSVEVLYYLQNSSATRGIDSSRIPRLRSLLQSQRKASAGRSA
jgi:chromosome segregation ATPase